MDILIPDSWLRDYLNTKATPEQVAQSLSLCSLSVDRLTTAADGDKIYHIEVPPNRYDCLSVLGVAREAAGALPRFNHPAEFTGGKIASPIDFQTTQSGLNNPGQSLWLEVAIENPKLCPRFSAIIIDNVEILASPVLITQRLEKSGVRSLNNIIDITNYIMLSLGQPMHAFDYEKLASVKGSRANKKMVLRESRAGEKLITLDGVERSLPVGAIVIDDGEKLIDLCGIMGGENSSISNGTKRVILFAQIYHPGKVRKSSLALSLRTEAVQRFEKGLDPEMVLPALAKSLEMAVATAKARTASTLIDLNPQPFKGRSVQMTQSKLDQYLALSLKPEEVIIILSSLGLPTTFDTKTAVYEAVVPSYRDRDIALEEDLIEEVARLYGYHNLPATLPIGQLPHSQPEPVLLLENKLKVLLKDFGFTEVINLSLTSKELAGTGELVKILNPLGPETEYLTADPFPAAVETVKKNSSRFPEIKVFETAQAYRPPKSGQKLPQSTNFLTLALYSAEFSDPEKAFLKVKGLAEVIFSEFSAENYHFKDYSTFPYSYRMALDEKASFVIWGGQEIKSGKVLGVGGPSLEIKNLWLMKINLNALAELIVSGKKFIPLPEYPPLVEEVSFYLPVNKTFEEAVKTIKGAGGEVLNEVSLSDVYSNPQLRQAGKRSMTLKLTFQSPGKTLTGTEVEPLRQNIIQALQEGLGAEPRTK